MTNKNFIGLKQPLMEGCRLLVNSFFIDQIKLVFWLKPSSYD